MIEFNYQRGNTLSSFVHRSPIRGAWILALGTAMAGTVACSSDGRVDDRDGEKLQATALDNTLLDEALGAAGASGIGDPYYPDLGNGGYDVSHYDIRLKYEPVSDLLAGTATITATALQDLSSFNLDFLLKVKSVRVNGRDAAFTSSAGELAVKPSIGLRKGTTMVVIVDYEDVPSQVTSNVAWIPAWRRTAGGALSTGEPFTAEWWFPCNNHPLDKATYDVSVAVPDGYEAISNGVLIAKSPPEDGWVRWQWRSSRPQVSYATIIAMGQYQIETGVTSSGRPFVNAYADDLGADAELARNLVNKTPAIIDFFSGKLGEYPFEAQGGIVARGRFGMETQTRPTYGSDLFGMGYLDYFIVHELAHEWFGDSVSLMRWRDLWLNEGFATYGEFLWSEHVGDGTAQDVADHHYDSHPVDDPFWQILPGDPSPGGDTHFHAAVYQRGAMTLQAVRHAVGDEAFFTILRTWLRQNRYGNATTDAFIALSERISGKSLRPLFDTWLYTSGRPTTRPSGTSPKVSAIAPRSYAAILGVHEKLDAIGHASLVAR
ncbi:M1 family metallopeptidase [Pendulispora rubella]|uniref:Aminopeptidase N n=1 Tax=Pendulispora rubella TaxID=2741070 RepID=A0ABZ2L438_9BACT